MLPSFLLFNKITYTPTSLGPHPTFHILGYQFAGFDVQSPVCIHLSSR
nr:MAG TPA: hypothetical protein [Caudoviricetes sp.]